MNRTPDSLRTVLEQSKIKCTLELSWCTDVLCLLCVLFSQKVEKLPANVVSSPSQSEATAELEVEDDWLDDSR